MNSRGGHAIEDFRRVWEWEIYYSTKKRFVCSRLFLIPIDGKQFNFVPSKLFIGHTFIPGANITVTISSGFNCHYCHLILWLNFDNVTSYLNISANLDLMRGLFFPHHEFSHNPDIIRHPHNLKKRIICKTPKINNMTAINTLIILNLTVLSKLINSNDIRVRC